MWTLQQRTNAVVLAALMILLVSSFAPAQTITGEIIGTVTDASGALVPGATAELVRKGTTATRTGTTNQAGLLVFAALPPGTYTLKAGAAGFRSFEQSGIVLPPNDQVSLRQIE